MYNNERPPPLSGVLVHIEYQGNKITIGSGMTILIAMTLSNCDITSVTANISNLINSLF